MTLHSWYNQNGMLLKSSKSEAVVLGTRAECSSFREHYAIDVAGKTVPTSDQIKSLGVTIDSGLTLDQHVSSIISACNYHLRAFRHIRPVLSNELAESIGRAIVLSKLDYCNSLHAGTSQSNLDWLQTVQNQCARIIHNLPYRESTKLARAQMHWLPVRERINFKLSVLAYSTLSSGAPGYLKDLLTDYVPARPLRSSSDANRLVIPTTRTKLQERCFRYAVSSQWNSLPQSIRSCTSLATFKSALKYFLFVNVYDVLN